MRPALEILAETAANRVVIISLWLMSVRGRYAGTAVGGLWAVLTPLLLVVLYTVVFSTFLAARVPGMPPGIGSYGLFVYAGILPWLLVNQSLVSAPRCLLDSGHLVRRHALAPSVFPMACVLNAAADAAISGVLFLAIVVVLRGVDPIRLLALLPATILLALLVAGMTFAISAVNMYGRDVSHALTTCLTLWFFGSPICYPAQTLPQELRWLLHANPLSGPLDLFRWSILGMPAPSAAVLTYSAGFSLLTFLAGTYLFQETRRDFVDLL